MEFVVVLLSPDLDFPLRVVQVPEDVFVQALVPESRVERLDECFLVGLARPVEVMDDTDGLDPGSECV